MMNIYIPICQSYSRYQGQLKDVDGKEQFSCLGFSINVVYTLIFVKLKEKLWSSGRALGSRSEGRGFDPRPMIDGSGVKAMPCQDRFLHPILVHYRKIQVAKWGTPKKYLKKIVKLIQYVMPILYCIFYIFIADSNTLRFKLYKFKFRD